MTQINPEYPAILIGATDEAGTNAKFFARADGQLFHESIADNVHSYNSVASKGRNPANAAVPLDSNNWSAFTSRAGNGTSQQVVTTHQIVTRKRFGTRRIIVKGRARRVDGQGGTAGVFVHTGEIRLSVGNDDTHQAATGTFQDFTLEADISNEPDNELMLITLQLFAEIHLEQHQSGTFTTEVFLSENLTIDQSS